MIGRTSAQAYRALSWLVAVCSAGGDGGRRSPEHLAPATPVAAAARAPAALATLMASAAFDVWLNVLADRDRLPHSSSASRFTAGAADSSS